jgi:hypothetical protein
MPALDRSKKRPVKKATKAAPKRRKRAEPEQEYWTVVNRYGEYDQLSYQFPSEDAAVMFANRHSREQGWYCVVFDPEGNKVTEFSKRKYTPKPKESGTPKDLGPNLQRKTDRERKARGLPAYGSGEKSQPKKTLTKKQQPVKRLKKRGK